MKRFPLGLCAVFVAGGVAVLFWPKDETSIGHTVTFSDGTAMTLEAVTHGTEHRNLRGHWRERIIQMLPEKLRAKYASRRGVMTSNHPSIAFWFNRRGSGPTNGALGIVLCDASGFGVGGGYTRMQLGTPGNWIEGWQFDSWPRRARTFTVRVYEPGSHWGNEKPVGQFTMRNPAFQRYPEWTPQRLPMTAHAGDLSITLFDLTAGVGAGSMKWEPARNPTVAMTRAGFRVERNGRLTKEWRIATVDQSDATGNVIAGFRGMSGTSSLEPDAEYAELQPHPWPSESAWKLRVGFTQLSNFVASELWTLRGVAVSGADVTNSSTQTNLPGGLLRYTGRTKHSSLQGDHQFNFRAVPNRDDYRITLIKATDEMGREAKLDNWFEGRGERTFALSVHSNATTLDFTLALHQTRFVEFVARPQIISSNAIAPR